MYPTNIFLSKVAHEMFSQASCLPRNSLCLSLLWRNWTVIILLNNNYTYILCFVLLFFWYIDIHYSSLYTCNITPEILRFTLYFNAVHTDTTDLNMTGFFYLQNVFVVRRLNGCQYFLNNLQQGIINSIEISLVRCNEQNQHLF